MPLMTPHTSRCQRGSSMIEVMVALFVLAIGLLGFAGLQTEGITMGRQAYMHSQAAILAQDMVERIEANKPTTVIDPVTLLATVNDVRGLYNVTFNQAVTAPVNCSASVCTPSQMVTWDISQWLKSIIDALPQGTGAVNVAPTVTGSGTIYSVRIRVQYQLAQNRLTRDENNANATPPATYTYVLETQI